MVLQEKHIHLIVCYLVAAASGIVHNRAKQVSLHVVQQKALIAVITKTHYPTTVAQQLPELAVITNWLDSSKLMSAVAMSTSPDSTSLPTPALPGKAVQHKPAPMC